ncbi:MAG: DUF342 domain-containing protein [Elusimicrobia bacterium]|nr:MAG: DUF342 domain-containing protein [Elusimicrobiota bacterium]
MSETPDSAIGNLADLEEGQITLSRFIVQHDGGLYVQRSQLEAARDFHDFVDRVFGSGLYFRALDYGRFLELVYGESPVSQQPGDDEVFVAADITTFRPERQALYKGLRISKGEAAYMFAPLYEELAGDAAAESGRRSGETRVRLDRDEFIAAAWLNGVRYGIDVVVVEEGLAVDKATLRVVARSRPFVAGKDAEIIEQAKGLHRNNAPRRLLSGRVDLRQFETRYPQVTAGVRLVKKAPRAPGIDGRDISGEVLPAPTPKDIDLDGIAGPGTRVSHDKDGEFLVAATSGFLQIDIRSHQFSIGDKIISHEGVSSRTTGDLALTGEVYEQHGEIQEKRIVKCRSITAYADVFGNIVSAGGTVLLKSNLIGGSASNDAGDIVVEGVASAARLVAPRGCVTVRRAENCVIIAGQAIIEQATHCDIVADELSLDLGNACAVAAKAIHVRQSRSRGEVDSVLRLLLPDLSSFATRISTLEQKQKALKATSSEHQRKIDALRAEKEVASYLALAGKLRRQELTLRPDQEVAWRRLSAQLAPTLRTLSQLGETVKEIDEETSALEAEIADLAASREAACGALKCTVDTIVGETRISTLLVRLGETPLASLPLKELKARLRRSDGASKLLFAGARGSFAWAYSTTPDEGDAPS